MSNDGHGKKIVIIGAFFFIFGFVSWINGTLIPYLQIACELAEWQAYLVTFAFYISYTIMAMPASEILRRTGMINGMSLGLLVMAVGCLTFIPAAYARSYIVFLSGLFIVGTGLTLLQTAVNPYITLLGPAETATRRMSIMGVCNKVAGILAPLIMGSIILKNSNGLLTELAQLGPADKAARLDELSKAVILPYSCLTIILLIVAMAIRYAHLPEINTVEGTKEVSAGSVPAESNSITAGNRSLITDEGTSITTDTIKIPADDKKSSITISNEPAPAYISSAKRSAVNLQYLLGFVAIFCGVGAEVLAGDTIGNYGIYHGIALDTSKSLTSWTLGCMMAGYLTGIVVIPRFVSQQKAFYYATWLGLILVLLIIALPGLYSIAALALLGFTNALLWPSIWPQALKGLQGQLLNKGSAILIMGIAGGALLPLVYGWLTMAWKNQQAYWLLVPIYLFLLYYSHVGQKQEAPVNKLSVTT